MKKILFVVLICTVMLAACSLPGQNVSSNTEVTGQVLESAEIPAEVPNEVLPELPTEAPTEIPTEIPTEMPTEVPTEIPTPTTAPHSSVLVVYFSRTGEQSSVGVIDKGNTEIVAEMIAEKTGADIFQIVPEVDNYPTTYRALTEVAKREQDENARPAYAGEVYDLPGYDTIFIGAPVWWVDWPMIMYTFFEQNEEALAGKTLIPFSTHDGSGLAGFDLKLRNALPQSNVGEGLAILGREAQNNREFIRLTVNNWLEGIGY